MNIIKELREKAALTQKALAQKTGLSLRTIQRLESGGQIPKGHSLNAIAKVFKKKPSFILQTYKPKNEDHNSDKKSIKLINLSALAFMLIPFGNIILPMIMWKKNNYTNLIDTSSRKIINFQIQWSLTLCLLMCITPFINIFSSFSIPLTLIILFIALVINLVVICKTAIMIQHDKNDFLNLPLQLI